VPFPLKIIWYQVLHKTVSTVILYVKGACDRGDSLCNDKWGATLDNCYKVLRRVYFFLLGVAGVGSLSAGDVV
jgi:hypothetical protein